MENIAQRIEDFERLKHKIKDIKVAMLTTVEKDGTLKSRPMANLDPDNDFSLWFFTNEFSGKVDEVVQYPNVNLTYVNSDSHTYISINGDAFIYHNPEKKKLLWNAWLRVWFPKGAEDPNLSLMKVTIHKAEFWDAPSGKMSHLIGIAKAVLTGNAADDNYKKLTF